MQHKEPVKRKRRRRSFRSEFAQMDIEKRAEVLDWLTRLVFTKR
jgi:hypothetical protein